MARGTYQFLSNDMREFSEKILLKLLPLALLVLPPTISSVPVPPSPSHPHTLLIILLIQSLIDVPESVVVVVVLSVLFRRRSSATPGSSSLSLSPEKFAQTFASTMVTDCVFGNIYCSLFLGRTSYVPAERPLAT